MTNPEKLEEVPSTDEEVEQPSAELSKEDIWTQISVGKSTTQPEPDPEPEPELKPEPKPEPSLENDPKLAKRFRDSQEFISKLKAENKEMNESLSRLQQEVEDLKKNRETQPKQNVPTDPVPNLQELLEDLPQDVRDELEAFPELFRGMTTLLDKRIKQMQQQVDPEIQEFRKERERRQVQDSLSKRHQLANQQLGILNARDIDFDSPTFAQWVLGSDYRKSVVTNFASPDAFVDLMRSFLFEYPDEAKRQEPTQPVASSPEPDLQKIERRKAASSVVSRKSAPERPKAGITSLDDKSKFWSQLMNTG
jgi:hypothetical protein